MWYYVKSFTRMNLREKYPLKTNAHVNSQNVFLEDEMSHLVVWLRQWFSWRRVSDMPSGIIIHWMNEKRKYGISIKIGSMPLSIRVWVRRNYLYCAVASDRARQRRYGMECSVSAQGKSDFSTEMWIFTWRDMISITKLNGIPYNLGNFHRHDSIWINHRFFFSFSKNNEIFLTWKHWFSPSPEPGVSSIIGDSPINLRSSGSDDIVPLPAGWLRWLAQTDTSHEIPVPFVVPWG